MKAAGVSEAGIDLVEALTQVLDKRWPNRQDFLDKLSGTEPKNLRLDRRRLSKELGSAAKRMGPDWHVAMLIARHCVQPEKLDEFVAQLAGLYCAARGVQRPPGYEGTVAAATGTQMAAAATTEALTRVQDELNRKVGEIEELRALHEGTFRALAECQASLDQANKQLYTAGRQTTVAQAEARRNRGSLSRRLEEIEALNAQVTTLSAQGLAKEEEVTRLGAQVTASETEIVRLTQQLMAQSAQYVAEQQQVRSQLDDARKTIAVQQKGLHDASARQVEHNLQAAALIQRHSNLREQYARLAAHIEIRVATQPAVFPDDPLLVPVGYRAWTPAPDIAHGRSSPPHRGKSPLAASVDPCAPALWRGLVVYLLIHQEHSGKHVTRIAQVAGISLDHVTDILTARRLPTPQQLASIAITVGAEITYARLLYDDANTALECRRWGQPSSEPARGFPTSPFLLPAPRQPGRGLPAPSLLPPAPHETLTPFNYLDPYESLVARFNGDNTTEIPPLPAAAPAVVAPSPGDSDMSPGDTTDSTASSQDTLSPGDGDTTIDTPRDDNLVPIRRSREYSATGAYAATVYESANRLQELRRRQRIVHTVKAASAVAVSLTSMLSALVFDWPISASTIFLGCLISCLAGSAMATMSLAVARRVRGTHQARHTPKQSPASTISRRTPRPAPTPPRQRDTPEPHPATDEQSTTRPRPITPIPTVAHLRAGKTTPATSPPTTAVPDTCIST